MIPLAPVPAILFGCGIALIASSLLCTAVACWNDRALVRAPLINVACTLVIIGTAALAAFCFTA